ncbi:MAG: FliH/SctL family protein [Thermoguttaceae bacterium]|jgi:flagellar assembly protein FliH
MSTIIRASDHNGTTHYAAFNFEDMAAQADRYLGKIRSEAARIVVKAQQEAESIRKSAEIQGRQAAIEAVEEMVRKQLTTVIPALKQAVQNIEDARHAWLSHWEAGTVHLAAAIAKRLIRRELHEQPEIPLALVREALELAAGSSQLRILLNPLDLQSLGNQVRMLVDELSPHIEAEITADAGITPGGCRVESKFGVIDQQFEALLQRIEEELK